jgi:hypothetical protein
MKFDSMRGIADLGWSSVEEAMVDNERRTANEINNRSAPALLIWRLRIETTIPVPLIVNNKLAADVPPQSMSSDFEIVMPWVSKAPLSRHLISPPSMELSCAFCRVWHGFVNAQVVLLLS